MKQNKQKRYSEKEKQEIFDNEFLPHIEAIYNFAYSLKPNVEEARDLVQETLLKAFRFITSFERGTNAKAWLFRILKNTFINEFRKQQRAPSKVDYQEGSIYYNIADKAEGLSKNLAVEVLKDLVDDEVAIALNALPIDFRTIIILSDLEGFTYKEIAKILDVPIGTVRSRLHRARNALKEKLQAYGKAMGYKDKRQKKKN
ncbi:MAG: sigma-70 family RNA polymerase sigma factor [Cytophagales bacterium]|nr:sigma-70 family RNA polymerase sigma factor [Cytophagales bacterium]